MARGLERATLAVRRFPHPRGDGPQWHERIAGLGMFSPPAWGWPEDLDWSCLTLPVFPTRVGMARTLAQ